MKLSRASQKKYRTAVIIFGMLFIFFFSSSMMTAKNKSLVELEQALKNGDVAVLQQLLSVKGADYVVSEGDIKRFLTYLDSFEKDKESLLESIKLGENHELLSINTQRKSMFFEDYVFQVKPFYIEFTTDEFVKEIEIVGVETLRVEGSDKIRSGPLMPGTYDIIATHHMGYVPDYTSKTLINTIPLIANDERVIKSEIDTRYVILQLYYGHDATLLVNGKETDIIIDNETKIYGIPQDGSVSLSVSKKVPWGEFTSEEVKITNKVSIVELNYTNEIVMKEIRAVAGEFANSFKEAFNKRDVALLKHVTPTFRENLEGVFKGLYAKGALPLNESEVEVVHYGEPGTLSEARFYPNVAPDQEEYYGTEIQLPSGAIFYSYYNISEEKWFFFDTNYFGNSILNRQ
jgi:uncharacterized membrane protein YvbJ